MVLQGHVTSQLILEASFQFLDPEALVPVKLLRGAEYNPQGNTLLAPQCPSAGQRSKAEFSGIVQSSVCHL